MKIPLCFLCFFLLIISFATAAEWVPLTPNSLDGSNPEIKIRSCNARVTELEITIPGFFMDRSGDRTSLYVPGWSMTEEVGLPALPKACALLALPEGNSVSIEVLEREDHLFKGMSLQIVQQPEVDGQAKPDPVEPLPWEGLFPAADGEQGATGAIKSLPVASVRVYPFRVEADTGRMTVSSRMVVAVHHNYARGQWPTVALTALTSKRCAASVLNFNYVPRAAAGDGQPEYLIITKPDILPHIQAFIDWKMKSGFDITLRTISFPNSTAVKNVILEYPDVDYVMLVGDTGDIPIAYWSGVPSDHWYACTTGGSNPDLFPDLCLGRLCGNDASRLGHQVDKILGYEKSPPLGAWLKNTILVAHGEQYPGKYTECKEEIATNMASVSDWTVTKYYGGENGTSNTGVSWLINQGVNLLNYRGHGDTQEWWSWNKLGESFYNSDVLALVNYTKHCTVLNIACNCGDITQYCMNEAWLDAEGGAVASLGATEPSYTIPNHDYDKEFYKAVFNMGLTDIGSATNHACDFIINYHGSLGQTNAKMYLWNGDASMKLWQDIPTTLNVSHATSVPAGSQDFTVTVDDGGGMPVPNASVCVYKDGEVYATGTTDPTGAAMLRISPTTSATDLEVIVVDDDYLPYEGTASVTQGSLHFDTFEVSARFGGTVNFALDAGASKAGRNYVLLGSVSGYYPGQNLPGGMVTLPLNFDILTKIIIANLNTTIFTDFMGSLDGSGQATAQLNSNPIDLTAVGIYVNFAYALNAPWSFASNSVDIKIVD